MHSTREEARVNKRILARLFFLTFFGIAQGVSAQDTAGGPGGAASPWYMGLGIGVTDASIPAQTVNDANAVFVAANGAASTIVDEKNRSTGLKILIGYKFNPIFAIEGGYASLGETSIHSDFRNGAVPSSSVGSFDLKYKMSGPFIDAVGTFPFNDRWSLMGRIGAGYIRTSADINGSPLTLLVSNNDKTENKVREKFGAGIDYNMSAGFTVRAEWERYKAPDPLGDDVFDIDTASVSLLFHF
jgi:OOP family OmpA-OmpF porin